MPAPPNVVAHKPHFHRDSSWKAPVRAATATAGTLASSFANGSTIDTVTLATGDRILVKNQSSGSENGLYTVNASGAPTRAYDMDVNTEVLGALVYVVAGGQAGTFWYCTNTAAVTLGSTSLAFSQIASTATGFVLSSHGGEEVYQTIAALGATHTLDLANGNGFDATLTANCTLTFSGATAGTLCSFMLLLRQNGTGGWTTTWPGSVVWAGGTAPTLSTTLSTASVLTFFTLDGGTTWYGFPTGEGTALGTAIPLVESGTGAAGTAVAASHEDHVHPAVAVDVDTLHEIVMQTGTSSPPVPIWNSAGDDWVYSS
jgi:hypothetical protein